PRPELAAAKPAGPRNDRAPGLRKGAQARRIGELPFLVLADDPELPGRGDVGVELDFDLVLAAGLDGLGHVQALGVEVDAGDLELARDVARGDRAEHLVVLADETLELERHAVETIGDGLSLAALLLDAPLDRGLLVLETRDVALRR